MHKISGIILVLVLVMSVVPSVAREMYIQSEQAPLWRSPSFGADKMTMIPRGGQVEIHEERQGWFLVRFQDQMGWMLKLMLSEHPPADGGQAAQQALREVDERSRLRPSAFASTAAARGLMNKEDGFGNQLKMDFEALKAMEKYRVSDKEARKFWEEGRNHAAKK